MTKGKVALVDDEDYEWLNKHSWYAQKNCSGWRAARRVRKNKNEWGTGLFMHREIMNPSDDMVVDHINHDGLDNRKENLRICSQQQNLMNMKPRKGTSKYKGVCWKKREKRNGLKRNAEKRSRSSGSKKRLKSIAGKSRNWKKRSAISIRSSI